jgi:uncharacterized membrane protein YfcA
MSSVELLVMGALSGTVAGLLAGLVGIGGGVVIVPVVYYGLLAAGTAADHAAYVTGGDLARGGRLVDWALARRKYRYRLYA